MNQVVTTLVPGGLALAQTLGFTAASAVVDNYTSNYVTLTDVSKTIPPWTYGAVVALPDGLRQANATLTPTVPAVAGPPVPNVQCSITWTDQVLPANPGHVLQQSAYAQQTILGTISAAAGTSSGTKNFAVPAGTASIGFDVNNSNNPLPIPSVITITGHQTRTLYVSTGGAGQGLGTGGPQWVTFDSADTSVDCSITAVGGGGGAIVDFLASPIAMATWLPGTVTVQQLATQNPLPWQTPNLGLQVVTGGLGAGATLQITAGGGNTVHTRLFQMMFSVEAVAATFGTIECPAGTVRGNWNGAVTRVYPFDWGGFDAGVNADLIIKNTSANPCGALNGFATVNQT